MSKLPEVDKQYGHPLFYKFLDVIADLHSRKNKDYAKGGNPLGNFQRVSKIFGLYPGLDLSKPEAIPLVYAMKQIDAVLWSMCQGYDGEVEGKIDRLQDVAVYALIEMVILAEQKEEELKTSK